MNHSIACVSFLNSKPLIEPLVQLDGGGEAVGYSDSFCGAFGTFGDVGFRRGGGGASFSIVDYQLAKHDLLLVPAGIIGCDGPTLTVRIFSKVPPEKISALHGDTDSHTSVLLAQLILRERYGAVPELIPFHPIPDSRFPIPDSLLLIGDKVVNAAPDAREYPHQLDLGQEWKALTGLPFVFACWMIRADMAEEEARELAGLLAWSQKEGARMTEGRWWRNMTRRSIGPRIWPGGILRSICGMK